MPEGHVGMLVGQPWEKIANFFVACRSLKGRAGFCTLKNLFGIVDSHMTKTLTQYMESDHGPISNHRQSIFS